MSMKFSKGKRQSYSNTLTPPIHLPKQRLIISYSANAKFSSRSMGAPGTSQFPDWLTELLETSAHVLISSWDKDIIDSQFKQRIIM